MTGAGEARDPRNQKAYVREVRARGLDGCVEEIRAGEDGVRRTKAREGVGSGCKC